MVSLHIFLNHLTLYSSHERLGTLRNTLGRPGHIGCNPHRVHQSHYAVSPHTDTLLLISLPGIGGFMWIYRQRAPTNNIISCQKQTPTRLFSTASHGLHCKCIGSTHKSWTRSSADDSETTQYRAFRDFSIVSWINSHEF